MARGAPQAIHLVRFGESERAFEFRELPVSAPSAGEIAIRVEASGLNFADVMARLGIYPDAPPLPFVPGYEVSGTIEAVGAGVSGLGPGQRVLAFTRFGGYASRLVVPASQVAAIPMGLGFSEATALATQGATAWVAAEHLVRLREGDHVLIHAAAGGVGSLLVQLAKRRKCVVYGTASTAQKQEFLRELGVDHVLPSREGSLTERVRKIRGDSGIDVIFDSIGGQTTREGMSLLGSGGRLVAYGVADMAKPGKKSLLKALNAVVRFGLIHPIQLMSASRSFLGLNLLRIADDRPALLQEALAASLALASKGELKPRVGREFEAREIAQAQDFLSERGSLGKVVIRWPTAS